MMLLSSIRGTIFGCFWLKHPQAATLETVPRTWKEEEDEAATFGAKTFEF